MIRLIISPVLLNRSFFSRADRALSSADADVVCKESWTVKRCCCFHGQVVVVTGEGLMRQGVHEVEEVVRLRWV